MSRVVDPQRFRAKGALVDWTTYARTHASTAEPVDKIAERRGTSPRTIQLRWAFDAAIGYPITPFTVWVRPPSPPEDPVGWVDTGLGLVLDETCVGVAVTLTTPSGGVVMAFPGMPLMTGPVGWAAAPAGTSTVWLSGPTIKVLTVPAGSTVSAVVRTPVADQDDPRWRPVEVVGLPSDGRASAFTDLTSPQGLVSAPTSPVDAALQRFGRGAPFYGWDDAVGGAPVPAWVLADPVAMVKVFNGEMLPDFVDMCDNHTPSSRQQLAEYARPLVADPQHVAEATFNPLRTLLYGGLSDPLAALVLGLGTAYPWEWFQGIIRESKVASAPDLMVTATFLDDLGNKTERAALVLRPGPATAPPAPAAMAAVSPGAQAPAQLDDPYGAVVTVSWDTPSELFPFDIGSHALGRRGITPSRPVELLMSPRPLDVALQPLGASRNDSAPRRRALSDTTWQVDSGAVPNDLRYAVASQDLFGQWSPWVEAAVGVAEPAVGRVTLTAARLDCPAAAGPCPATLTFDLAWDWTSRSPDTLTVVGRRYAQTWPSDPPTDTSTPTGDAFLAGGTGALVTLHLDPAGAVTAVVPGAGMSAGVQHLTVDGQHVSAGPLADRGPRRYRVSVTGFSLDFGAASRWGVALWAWGTEHRPPHRVGTPGTPTVVSAADPRPPVIVSSYDDVLLASLRDTEGLHHARLTWAPMGGAVGYHLYTCSEATLRAFHARPEPRRSDTLRTRLAELQQIFGADPERRPFTRVGTELLTGTSTQVTLPRGTKEIHLYVVVGVSAGNVESAWPVASDPQCGKRILPVAAPVTIAPGAPALEVARGDDGGDPPIFHARLRIASAPGAQVGRIDLHRTRVPEAAGEVETMGPPVASITASGAGWSVRPVTASGTGPDQVGVAQQLGVLTGTDAVGGSWKPVYYRAVAWGQDDPGRGQYGVRSAPSTPRSVLVPPSSPPDLGGPLVVLPTAGSADARLDLTTTAPVGDSVLGPHRLEAEALLTTPAGTVTPVALTPGSAALSSLATTAPAAGASGLWRDPTASGTTPLHLLVRRTDATAVLGVRIRLTDPLGRITEKVVDVPAGAAGTDPDIVNPLVDALTRGWLLSFLTHAPDTTPGGAVRLEVRLRAGRGRPVRWAADLADLPRPPRGPRGLAPALSGPVHAYATRRTAGARSIGVLLGSAGTVSVSLVTAEGARATVTRTIGRIRFP